MTYNIPVRPDNFTERFINHPWKVNTFTSDINTRYHAVSIYQSGRYSIKYVTRKYHISKSSLMRWVKRFDGSKDSLLNQSHRPHTSHPNSHTSSLYRWLKTNGYYEIVKIKQTPNKPKPYQTPELLGENWQS